MRSFPRQAVCLFLSAALSAGCLLAPASAMAAESLAEGMASRMADGDYAGALKFLTEYQQANKEDPQVRVELGRLHLALGQAEKAVETWKEGLGSGDRKRDAQLWYLVASVRLQQYQDGPFLRRAKGKVAELPKPESGATALEVQFKRDRLDEALRGFRAAYTMDPTNTALGSAFANALLIGNEQREAANVLSGIHRAEPKNAAIAADYGSVLWLLGDKKQAVAILQKALALDDAIPRAHRLMADYFIEAGNPTQYEVSKRKAEFYEWLPPAPVCQIKYSPEAATYYEGVRKKMRTTANFLLAQNSAITTDLIAAICWHGLAIGALDDACYQALIDRGAGDKVAAIAESAPSSQVLRSAAKALAKAKHPRALAILSRMLRFDSHPLQRVEAADALELLGDLQAVPVLVEVFREPIPGSAAPKLERDGHLQRRREICLALGALGGAQATLILDKALGDPDLQAYAALAQFRMTGDNRYRPAALALVESEPPGDSLVRRYAARIGEARGEG